MTQVTPNHNPSSVLDDDWDALQRPPRLTSEQVIQWLEGYRELMFEVWRSNPGTYRQWQKAREYPPKK